MSTNELPSEKCIASDCPDLPALDHPPVPPQDLLAPETMPEVDAVLAAPPATRLLLEGLSREEITVPFLTDVMDVADARGLSLDGISVGQPTGK